MTHPLMLKKSLRCLTILSLWVLIFITANGCDHFHAPHSQAQVSEVPSKTKIQTLSHLDRAEFFRALRDEFTPYKSYFKTSGKRYGLPWQLIAAVAYQESHWQSDARSFTGVRGLMMLTTNTAECMGIDDRTDPEQSVAGGAKYLKFLLNLQPMTLAFQERLLLALAAYNIGLAHLRDAQELALRFDLNPQSWKDLKKVLPLLEDPFYSSTLKFGAARGKEPVKFVHQVEAYYELLTVKP